MTELVFFIGILTKALTFGNYVLIGATFVRLEDTSYYSSKNGEWYAFSRSYWESYAKTYPLTKNDICKLNLIGWGDLVPVEKSK